MLLRWWILFLVVALIADATRARPRVIVQKPNGDEVYAALCEAYRHGYADGINGEPPQV